MRSDKGEMKMKRTRRGGGNFVFSAALKTQDQENSEENSPAKTKTQEEKFVKTPGRIVKRVRGLGERCQNGKHIYHGNQTFIDLHHSRCICFEK